MKFLIIFCLTLSCTHLKSYYEPKATTNQVSLLQQKADLYLRLSEEQSKDRAGWPRGCDGLLWASLFRISGGDIDLHDAESERDAGRWYRTPEQNCFKDGRSASTISRDMLTGLALALWETEDKDAIDRLLSYGKKKHWIMGDAKDLETIIGRTLMSPQLVSTYYQIRHKLGGEKVFAQNIPLVLGNVTGYKRHLNLLHLYIRASIKGRIDGVQLRYLKRVIKDQPQNALAQAIYHKFNDGNQSVAISILMDETLFPAQSLPNNHDHRCSDYLWQRDFGSNWEPCKEREFETHNGIDFLFVAHIIFGG